MIFYKSSLVFQRTRKRSSALESLQPRLDLSTSLLGKEMVPDQRRHASQAALGDNHISFGTAFGIPKLKSNIGNRAPIRSQNQAKKSETESD